MGFKMKEKKSIDNWEEFLNAELLEEAEKIMAEVEADEEIKNIEFPKELDQKVLQRIREEEEKRKAYEMLSEEDKEAIRIGREEMIKRELEKDTEFDSNENTSENNIVPYRRKKRAWKVYLLVAVVAVMVLGIGMTSIGGSPFILEMVDAVIGQREMTRIDSQNNESTNNVHVITDEEQVEQEIEETFGIIPVKMGYLPKDTIFLKCDTDKENNRIYLFYQWENQIIEYQIIVNYRKYSYGYDIEDELLEEKTIVSSDVPITIKKYCIPDGTIQFNAQFEYKEVYYNLNGAIPEEELKKIVENLIFF